MSKTVQKRKEIAKRPRGAGARRARGFKATAPVASESTSAVGDEAQVVEAPAAAPEKSRAVRNTVRMCMVCREERPTRKLLRIHIMSTEQGEELAFEPSGDGRGAHICITKACLLRLNERGLAKALREPVSPLGGARWLVDLRALAERRVLETLGLARRMAILTTGVDDICEMSAEGGGESADRSSAGVILVARDLSQRGLRRLQGANVFVSADELGQAIGKGTVGAVHIAAGSLAARAAYWLAIWYELRSEVA